jgi:hypothetical protein
MNTKNISNNNKYYSYLFILVLLIITAFRPVGIDYVSKNYAHAIQSFIITHNYDFIRTEPFF